MTTTQEKRIFQVHLSISIVLLLLTLGTLSLFASFYLGMITGKSMQRPTEVNLTVDEFPMDNSLPEEDLKFFGLGETKKGQDFLDIKGIKELNNKTEELSKFEEIKKITPPKISKTVVPKVTSPEIINKETKKIKKDKSILTKLRDKKYKDIQIKDDVIYTIQVLASRNQKNAKNLVEKLKKDGFNNAFIFEHAAGNKTLYRVRVGKIEQKETKKLANKLKKLKYIDSVQVSRF